ncbi:MAG: hypothetical protein IJA72_03720, partial [Clostridia bacterium]|nr:hypothetical protein [Clostridia bacterium]
RVAGVVLGIAALTAVAVPVTLFVNRVTTTTEYEIMVETSGVDGAQKYSIDIKKGATIGKLKTRLNVIQGHQLIGVFKDAEFQQEYNDNDKVTANTQVYLKYEKEKYVITLPSAQEQEENHYKIQYSNDVNINEVEWGEAFVFWIDFEPGYNSNNARVFVAGDETPLQLSDKGYYILNFVDQDVTLNVEYTIALDTYALGSIPAGVKVVRTESKANAILGELTSNSIVYYGDKLNIYYTETEGYAKTKFTINNIEYHVDSYDEEDSTTVVQYEVSSDVAIQFEEKRKTFDLILPSGTGYTLQDEDGEVINITNPLNWGTQVKFKIALHEGYTEATKVMYAGQELTAVEGVYTIVVKENSAIQIDGVQLKEYLATFKNGDTVIYSSKVTHGGSVEIPSNPSKPADAQNTYNFEGWSIDGENIVTEFTNITGDVVYQAKYGHEVRNYHLNSEYDGCTFSISNSRAGAEIDKVQYGDILTITATPSGEYSEVGLSVAGASIQTEATEGNSTIWTVIVTDSVLLNGNKVDVSVYGLTATQYMVELVQGEGYTLQFETDATTNATIVNHGGDINVKL